MTDHDETMQPTIYYTVEEVADSLRVDPAFIYREIKRGHLPAIRIGGRVLRVAQADLRAYLLRQRTGTAVYQ